MKRHFTLLVVVATVWATTTGAAYAQDTTDCETSAAPAASCLSRYRIVGLPSYRSEDDEDDTALICRAGYAVSFNCETGNPDWVIERIVAANLVGSAKRRDKFTPDPLLGDHGPQLSDYEASKHDRGHQAPAADFKASQALMDESFYLTNMSPQVGPGFNQGAWKRLEGLMRSWVLCGGRKDLIVITGPIFSGDLRPVKSGAKVMRPDAYFKIAYDVRSGRAVAFRYDNAKTPFKTPFASKVVEIDQIEDETGLNFFEALTPRRQSQLESNRGVAWGFDDSCAGAKEE